MCASTQRLNASAAIAPMTPPTRTSRSAPRFHALNLYWLGNLNPAIDRSLAQPTPKSALIALGLAVEQPRLERDHDWRCGKVRATPCPIRADRLFALIAVNLKRDAVWSN